MQSLKHHLAINFPQPETALIEEMATTGDLRTIQAGDVIIQSGKTFGRPC